MDITALRPCRISQKTIQLHLVNGENERNKDPGTTLAFKKITSPKATWHDSLDPSYQRW